MTAREYLGKYQQANREIDIKLLEISRLRDMATGITQALGNDPVQSSPGNKLETIISKIVDMEREVDGEVDQLQEVKQEVAAVIDQVPDTRRREILGLRYICGMTFEQIANEMRYSERQVYRIFSKALKDVSACQY